MTFGTMQNKNLLQQPISDLESIKQLLPHREPMIMVDGLLYFDGNKAVSSLTIKKSNILVTDEFFSETGLIEHMAQSAALLTGYRHKSQKLPIKEGFIAAIKNLTIQTCPKVDEVIHTEATIAYEMVNMTIMQLTSRVNKTIIAMAEMTLALKDSE